MGDGHHLAKHDGGVAVQERNAGQTLAGLEVVHHQGLSGLEHDLSHLVSLQGVGLLHLLATGLLADLPVDLGDTAGGAAAAHEADGGVAGLDLAGDVQSLDLGGEVLDGLQGGVGLQDHDVTGAGQVVLVQTLDVHADVVARAGLVHALVVHLHGEHLAGAGVGSGMGGHEDDFLTGLDDALLDAASQHITNTLDLVGAGDGETHGGVGLALGHGDEVVQGVEEGVDVAGVALLVDHVHAVPPAHVSGLGDQVVSLPAGDGEDGHALLNEVRLPPDAGEHVLHLIADLNVALLLVAGDIGIHLVHANNELLDTEQVDQASVLASLALDLSGLVVTLLDGGGEVTVSGHHEQAHVSLSGTGNHVLNEIPVAGGVDDGVMPVVSEELLGGARNGHTTLALLLLPVHVEGEGEGLLAEGSGLFLELLQLTLGDAAELEQQAASRSGLATIDVAADDCRNIVARAESKLEHVAHTKGGCSWQLQHTQDAHRWTDGACRRWPLRLR